MRVDSGWETTAASMDATMETKDEQMRKDVRFDRGARLVVYSSEATLICSAVWRERQLDNYLGTSNKSLRHLHSV